MCHSLPSQLQLHPIYRKLSLNLFTLNFQSLYLVLLIDPTFFFCVKVYTSCSKHTKQAIFDFDNTLDGLKNVLSSALCAEDIPETIVFCRTKEVTCKVYEFLLCATRKRDYIAMYHANLTQHTKTYVWDNFKSGQI